MARLLVTSVDDVKPLGTNAQALAAEDPMISYLYCGAPFVPASGNLSHALLPDALHPSTAGYRLLAACIAPVLGPLVHSALTTLMPIRHFCYMHALCHLLSPVSGL